MWLLFYPSKLTRTPMFHHTRNFKTTQQIIFSPLFHRGKIRSNIENLQTLYFHFCITPAQFLLSQRVGLIYSSRLRSSLPCDFSGVPLFPLSMCWLDGLLAGMFMPPFLEACFKIHLFLCMCKCSCLCVGVCASEQLPTAARRGHWVSYR